MLAAAPRCSAAVAAFAAAALLAFGPSYLYFCASPARTSTSRRSRSALLVAIWRFLDRPRTYHPALIGALLALSFATKETTFITVFVMGSFFLVALCFPSAGASRSGRRVQAPPGWEGWGWALAAFAGVFTLLFTTFLTHPRRPLGRRLHGPEVLARTSTASRRGGEPWQFYSVVLVTIEWPALLLGAIGAVSLWQAQHAASPPS